MTKIRIIQFINHLLFFVGILYVLITEEYQYFFLSIIAYYIIGILGINIGFHRMLAHRSFSTYKPISNLLIILGTLAAMGSSLAWVAVHRQHHRYSDTDQDPHSPHRVGIIKSWFGFWGKIKIDLKNCKDLRRSHFHRFLHKNYFAIHAVYVTILVIVNPLLVLFLYAIPTVLVFHSAGAFDVIAHMHGYRNHDTQDKSKNSWLANLITMGEGWHNNHHAKPNSYSNWEKWWEVDPTGIIIALIKKSDK